MASAKTKMKLTNNFKILPLFISRGKLAANCRRSGYIKKQNINAVESLHNGHLGDR